MRQAMLGVILWFMVPASGHAAFPTFGEMGARPGGTPQADLRFDGAGRKGGGAGSEMPAARVPGAGDAGVRDARTRNEGERLRGGLEREGGIVSMQADAGGGGLSALAVGFGVALFSIVRRMRRLQ
ncbi:MAG: hypothetical protein KIT13_06785 [Burkholderiales bacterium]|nr:hypothetical protein [Burkholderiales bacterium]MCW5603271.1 hypothetical protein [Burkholderiales bacterium]